MSAALPLAGIRVLDFGHIVAGPFCARLLADLGAEVVKIETRSRLGQTGARKGDEARRGRHGRPPLLAHINRNRRSVDLDLKSEAGRETAKKLAAVTDVIVENFSSGVMDRLGLGYEDLRALNPRLVFASMSGYGHLGSRRRWTSMNVNLQAHCGLMMATGNEGGPPIGISNSWNDYLAGLHACYAILGALAERRRTGSGRHLDVSQFECCVSTLGAQVLAAAIDGRAPLRMGNRSAEAAPQGCYPCRGEDAWCVISVRSDAQWQALSTLLKSDAPQLQDARFATLAGRQQHHDAIDAAIAGWTKARSKVKAEVQLREAGVPAERVRRADDMLETPAWRELRGAQGFVGLPFRFRHARPVTPVPAVAVGENNDEVLGDWLGVAAAAESAGR